MAAGKSATLLLLPSLFRIVLFWRLSRQQLFCRVNCSFAVVIIVFLMTTRSGDAGDEGAWGTIQMNSHRSGELCEHHWWSLGSVRNAFYEFDCPQMITASGGGAAAAARPTFSRDGSDDFTFGRLCCRRGLRESASWSWFWMMNAVPLIFGGFTLTCTCKWALSCGGLIWKQTGGLMNMEIQDDRIH